nr:MAG TPA: hypothetical protein [Caudoviricetes sp.]
MKKTFVHSYFRCFNREAVLQLCNTSNPEAEDDTPIILQIQPIDDKLAVVELIQGYFWREHLRLGENSNEYY